MTMDSYQNFIQESRAEFGLAKHGYVAIQGGWFSDRSVCAFSDISGAFKGVELITLAMDRHCRTARETAEQCFACAQVLPPLIETAMD